MCSVLSMLHLPGLSFLSFLFVLELFHNLASVCTVEWWLSYDASVARLLLAAPMTPASVGDWEF